MYAGTLRGLQDSANHSIPASPSCCDGMVFFEVPINSVPGAAPEHFRICSENLCVILDLLSPFKKHSHPTPNTFADSIDLVALPFASVAFAGIEAVTNPYQVQQHNQSRENRFTRCVDREVFQTLRYSRTKRLFYYMVWKLNSSPTGNPRPSSVTECSKPSRLHGRQW